jgi:hypothetical protein
MDPNPRLKQPERRQFSLRGLLRTTSCICVLSAVPGFWGAIVTLVVGFTLLLLPALGILLTLMLAQAGLYVAWQRAAVRREPSQNPAGQNPPRNDEAYFRAQVIQRR